VSAVEDRLAALGRSLPELVPPAAAYVPAKRSGSHVWTAGQVPMVDGSLPAVGKVGVEVTAEQAYELARMCALNALAAVKSVVGDLDEVVQVVKVLGFVAVDPSFTAISGVVNGASDLLVEAFGDAGRHARSAIGVAALPLDSPVEVELVVEVR
jgi:enamine deaminase RidA (YjgF/YER057c/UK114 family)